MLPLSGAGTAGSSHMTKSDVQPETMQRYPGLFVLPLIPQSRLSKPGSLWRRNMLSAPKWTRTRRRTDGLRRVDARIGSDGGGEGGGGMPTCAGDRRARAAGAMRGGGRRRLCMLNLRGKQNATHDVDGFELICTFKSTPITSALL